MGFLSLLVNLLEFHLFANRANVRVACLNLKILVFVNLMPVGLGWGSFFFFFFFLKTILRVLRVLRASLLNLPK